MFRRRMLLEAGAEAQPSGTWVKQLHDELLTSPDLPTQSSQRFINVANITQWNAAMDDLQAGDYINITAGFNHPNSRIDDAPGTAANPIIVNGNGHTQTSSSNFNPWFWKSASHFYLYDIHFDADNTALWGPAFGGLYGGQPAGETGTCNDVHVWRCEIEKTEQQALVFKSMTNGSIIGNYIHHISKDYDPNAPAGSGSGSMIYLGGAGNAAQKCADILIERNHLAYNGPNAVTRPLNVKTHCERVTFRRNYCHDIVNRANGLITFFPDGLDQPVNAGHLVEENVVHDTPQYEDGGSGMSFGQSVTARRNIVFNIGVRGIRANKNGHQVPVEFDANTVWNCTTSDIGPPGSEGNYGAAANDTAPTYTVADNLCEDTTGQYQATAADFVGPVTGTADAGDGPGSGFLIAASSSLPANAGALGKAA